MVCIRSSLAIGYIVIELLLELTCMWTMIGGPFRRSKWPHVLGCACGVLVETYFPQGRSEEFHVLSIVSTVPMSWKFASTYSLLAIEQRSAGGMHIFGALLSQCWYRQRVLRIYASTFLLRLVRSSELFLQLSFGVSGRAGMICYGTSRILPLCKWWRAHQLCPRNGLFSIKNRLPIM